MLIVNVFSFSGESSIWDKLTRATAVPLLVMTNASVITIVSLLFPKLPLFTLIRRLSGL